MTPLEISLKTIIKEAIYEALDEYQTKISAAAPAVAQETASTEPGTHRRKTKAESKAVEAVEDKKEAVNAEVSSDPAQEYKKIQHAVVSLVNLPGGKDKVVKVLNHFGVQTALTLTPAQYAEALALLEAALVETPLA